MGFFDLFRGVKEEDKADFGCVDWHPEWVTQAKKTIDDKYGGRAPSMFMRIKNQTSKPVVVTLKNDVKKEYWKVDVNVPAEEVT